MKKLSYILLLMLFAFFACQTDQVTTEVDVVNIDDTKLKRTQNDATVFEILNNIPEKFKDNPGDYIRSLQPKNIEDDDDCVYFSYPFAFIQDGCTIQDGLPNEFRNCNTTDVIYLDCGYEPYINCFVCLVEFTIKCDGRKTKVFGYDIRCLGGNPQPL